MFDKTKTFHIPTFNSKEEEFAVFWPRFQAYGTLKKFSKVLKEDNDLPDDPEDLSSNTIEKKLEKEAIEANEMAVATFTMAFTTAGLMEHVEESKNDAYPGGVAYEIVKKLTNKYRPADRISGVEAEKELLKLKMRKEDDPDEYFSKLAVLKNKYRKNKTTFDEEKMIAATLAKAPKKYSAVLTGLLQSHKGGTLT